MADVSTETRYEEWWGRAGFSGPTSVPLEASYHGKATVRQGAGLVIVGSLRYDGPGRCMPLPRFSEPTAGGEGQTLALFVGPRTWTLQAYPVLIQCGSDSEGECRKSQ